jgi:hypothetical protein
MRAMTQIWSYTGLARLGSLTVAAGVGCVHSTRER